MFFLPELGHTFDLKDVCFGGNSEQYNPKQTKSPLTVYLQKWMFPIIAPSLLVDSSQLRQLQSVLFYTCEQKEFEGGGGRLHNLGCAVQTVIYIATVERMQHTRLEL